ncbi:bifunctional isocitrate dehydrogenase kinase/phosphatase [Neisseriaceae bacterium TC5R-5]|nr:bifunctional isocitrate dehydrogenase kinase/phosphatase [Neisseriaceae bacterium TC5R-5]
MQIPESYNPVARDIAQALIAGFDKHYRLFRECNRSAKTLFEAADWPGIQQAVSKRIQFYDDRVSETVMRLHKEFHADKQSDEIWQQAKLYFIALLANHKQPELAETFFNSVFTRILHRDYFNNDFIFIRPAISTEYIESDPPSYRSYYPSPKNFRHTITNIIHDFNWQIPFTDLRRDLRLILKRADEYLRQQWPKPEANYQIQVLATPFYRNKAAYIFGKVINGSNIYPFAIPVLNDAKAGLSLDIILLEPWQIGMLFSFSRAYFLADMEVPSGYIRFLTGMLPGKTKAELYTMLGLQKQGKNTFYRDFMQHLQHSNDEFMIAPGIRGLVMLVFTLPSYPYVFKLIKDVFGVSKEVDRKTVIAKYQLVKKHDRVGRLADTLEFSNVAFPKHRFTEELLQELRTLAPSMLEEFADQVIIKHLYIERRMKPLNLYLMNCDKTEKTRIIKDYGQAIKELASANIFPGDMLFKNFGVTRYGRVIFYDYDEIEYMTDCHFRHIPIAPNPEMEMSGEVWYPVARNDVFPEEFASFLLGDPEIRKVFMEYHADLLQANFWQQRQQRISDGYIEDFYPYPEEERFIHRYPQYFA